MFCTCLSGMLTRYQQQRKSHLLGLIHLLHNSCSLTLFSTLGSSLEKNHIFGNSSNRLAFSWHFHVKRMFLSYYLYRLARSAVPQIFTGPRTSWLGHFDEGSDDTSIILEQLQLLTSFTVPHKDII